MSVTINKHRTTDGKRIDGIAYTLTFTSSNDTHTVTIETKKTNPIPEDQVKQMLVSMAAHDDLNTFVAAISEYLTIQDLDADLFVCVDPDSNQVVCRDRLMINYIPEDEIEQAVIRKYNYMLNAEETK